MPPRRLATRKPVARTAASSRPSRQAATAAEEKTRGVLVKPKPKPKPQPTVDRSVKNSHFDREVPHDILFLLMNKYLDDATATCFGLTCKKAHTAWGTVFNKGTVDLFEQTTNAAGVTLPLKLLLMNWMGPDMHFDALTSKYMNTEDINEHYDAFHISFTDWQANDEDEREWQTQEDARRDEEDAHADRQRRLHAGTVAHAYQVAGCSSHKNYDSELEEESNSDNTGDVDSMEIDEENESGDNDENGEDDGSEDEEDEDNDGHANEIETNNDAMDEGDGSGTDEIMEEAGPSGNVESGGADFEARYATFQKAAPEAADEILVVLRLYQKLPPEKRSGMPSDLADVAIALPSVRTMAIFLARSNFTQGVQDTIYFLTDARALERLQTCGFEGAFEREERSE
ncbi:uncharacterized protein PAC_03725 [Phialocephala subalpina]|uniref:Uncharacterized protein n=1 Tax=Phialocephala subalpina TaxID=576137 RepID=A0A1L7WM41_9HELO|nr:uncharacterized protein PAC_03725 [Phialocephala subalpina]